MGINADGFLSEDIERWMQEKRVLHADRFKLVVSVNRTGQRMLRLLGQVPRSLQNLLMCAFYVRALQSLQGAVLMAERGLVTEARTLGRSVLETLFYLGAARRDEEFQKAFASDHVKRMNIVAGEFIKALEGAENDEAVKKLQADLSALEAQGVDAAGLAIVRVAQKADMERLYQTLYREFSTNAAHPTLIALEPIWDRAGPTDEPAGVNWGPDKGGEDSLPDVLLQLAMLGILLIAEMNKMVQSKTIAEALEDHGKLHLRLLETGVDAPVRNWA